MSKKTFIPTIGLEIHAELKTASKMFCRCKNDPNEAKPNINICPICLGHPGTLPVLNHEAIRHVIMVGRAIGGTIADYTEWDRKNYFYPDIPKGYQISQYKYPLVSGGMISVQIQGQTSANTRSDLCKYKVGPCTDIAITRLHLEEDTASSIHDAHDTHSLVDFNRSGVPLLELVTEPVIHSAGEAAAFAKELQLLLRTLGVAEANMEKGEMRVEANVSVAEVESTESKVGSKDKEDSGLGAHDFRLKKLGTKTEVKNLNSFRSVERAIEYEIKRQSELLEKGEKVVQETRGWDENAGKTYSQRSKESSHDYRYFPEPDLPKLIISEIPEFSAEEIAKNMPELPWAKRARYIRDFQMTDKEAAVFVESPKLALYFELIVQGQTSGLYEVGHRALSRTSCPKSDIVRLAINYILTDYMGLLKKDHGEDYAAFIQTIEPKQFAALLEMIAENQLSSRGAKDLLAIMYQGDHREPGVIAEEMGLVQKNDEGALIKIVNEIIATHPTVVADYKSGKTVALQFLVGQGMKASKGSANPGILKKMFSELLSNV